MTEPSSVSNDKTGKTCHFLFCFSPLCLFPLLILGLMLGGIWILLPVFLMLVITPVLDTLSGWQSDYEFTKEDFSNTEILLLENCPRFYAVLYFTSVLITAYLLPNYELWEVGMLILVFSLIAAICFAVTHELLHRQTWLDLRIQFIGSIFLCYPHYRIIHLRSHHIQAATDEDKNTAWIDEGYPAYLMRTIPESFNRSWGMEQNRLGKKGGTGSHSLLRNKVLLFWMVEILFLLAILGLFGFLGLVFVLGQIVGANLILESVNYLQHYGLMRNKSNGQYEKIRDAHSWDSYHFFSSYLTFRVGHHAYHHVEPNDPYYLLRPQENSPKLPVGYFLAILIAMIPPIWKAMAHPRLESAVDNSHTNISSAH